MELRSSRRAPGLGEETTQGNQMGGTHSGSVDHVGQGAGDAPHSVQEKVAVGDDVGHQQTGPGAKGGRQVVPRSGNVCCLMKIPAESCWQAMAEEVVALVEGQRLPLEPPGETRRCRWENHDFRNAEKLDSD